jgi:hypothetical protein
MSVSTRTDKVPDEIEPWVELLSRLGYATKGVVYTIVGILALQAAAGTRSANVSTSDALTQIYTQPFGRILLIIVGVGLAGYVLWREMQAFLDPERNGSDMEGVAKRVGYFFSGLGYAALAFSAFQLVFTGRGGGSNSTQNWTARAMGMPAGRWLIGVVGLVVVGVGLAQFVRAFKASFKKHLDLSGMDSDLRSWTIRIGQAGTAARGTVYVLIGLFLGQAAWQYDPQEAGGLGQALQKVVQQPYGPWLLAVIAVGLIAYGLYALIMSRYRRIPIE